MSDAALRVAVGLAIGLYACGVFLVGLSTLILLSGIVHDDIPVLSSSSLTQAQAEAK